MDKVHSEERRFTPVGIEIDIGWMVLVCVSVCLSVQGLSLTFALLGGGGVFELQCLRESYETFGI